MQRNITHNFCNTYLPVKALLIYTSIIDERNAQYDTQELYVESYDISPKTGRPINAHPLTLQESLRFGEALRSQQAAKNSFLQCRGILPRNLLYVNTDSEGYAIWYTPPMERELFFVEQLGIPSGLAKIPAMIWKGSRESLSVYALKSNRKPQLNSTLFHAPYFNMYRDGRVCMGTVKLDIHTNTCLEDFMSLWENYFFNSYFSHTIEGGSNAGTNIVQLWQGQVGTGNKFPEGILVNASKTIKDIIQ